MPRVIRFHLDENVESAIASGLRKQSIDVTTTTEAGIRKSGDETQMAFAKRSGRVLFTQDCDFTTLAPMSCPHPGVFYCKQGKHPAVWIIRELSEYWEMAEPEDLADRLVSL